MSRYSSSHLIKPSIFLILNKFKFNLVNLSFEFLITAKYVLKSIKLSELFDIAYKLFLIFFVKFG